MPLKPVPEGVKSKGRSSWTGITQAEETTVSETEEGAHCDQRIVTGDLGNHGKDSIFFLSGKEKMGLTSNLQS